MVMPAGPQRDTEVKAPCDQLITCLHPDFAASQRGYGGARVRVGWVGGLCVCARARACVYGVSE